MPAVWPSVGNPTEQPCVHPCYIAGVDRVGVRELRNHTAAAVRRAGAGERIVITVDGRPVAQLGPIEPGRGAGPTLDDLAARGLVVLPRRADRPGPVASVPVWAGFRFDRVLRDVRGR
jgi:prevent-host-death family protein